MPLVVDGEPEGPGTAWEQTAERVAATEAAADASPVSEEEVEAELAAMRGGGESAVERAREGFSGEAIQRFLLDLVPEAGEPVRWVDCSGRAYEAPPFLSARRQFQVARVAKRVGDRFFAAVRGASRGGAGTAAIALNLLGLIDEEMLAELDQVFAIAHPEALAKARAARPGFDELATDLFPAEELVKAIVPFFARPLSELARVAGLGAGSSESETSQP
jgi:hypothetical protein